MDSAGCLAQANVGMPAALGRRIAVIGGGSAALDGARSARRAGHEVTIIALEAAARMPAQHEELVEAREEGITHVIFGQSARTRWDIFWHGSVINRFLAEVKDAAVHVIPVEKE